MYRLCIYKTLDVEGQTQGTQGKGHGMQPKVELKKIIEVFSVLGNILHTNTFLFQNYTISSDSPLTTNLNNNAENGLGGYAGFINCFG
jgi:hypothetical protein